MDDNDNKKQPPSIRASFDNEIVTFPVYHDLSVSGNDRLDNERQTQVMKIHRQLKITQESFPMKLYRMLVQVESIGLSHVVSFQPHGRAIRVHERQKFESGVLPRYFPDITKFKSFQRQLNFYNFLRMKRHGPDQGSYYHAMFLRGRPDICRQMKCSSKSQHAKRQTYDAKTEPNFYIIPSITVLSDCHEESIKSGNDIALQQLLPKATSDDRMIESTIHDIADNKLRIDSTTATALVSGSSFRHSNNKKRRGDIKKRSSQLRMRSGSEMNGQQGLFNDVPNNSSLSRDHSTATTLSKCSSGNITHNNSSIPADVVDAARSILAPNSQLLHAKLLHATYTTATTMDPSYAIVDQYCRN